MKTKKIRASLLTVTCSFFLVAGCASNRSSAQNPFATVGGSSAAQMNYQTYSRTNQLTASAIAEIQLAQTTQPGSSEQRAALATLWRNLQNLPMNDLVSNANNANELIRGWFQLGLLTQQHANQPAALVKAIRGWQQQYPAHPGNQILPSSDQLFAAAVPEHPQHIALLLPLEGSFAGMGKAVRDGFMTAYYANMNRLAVKPTVKVYNTNNQDVNQVYLQALADGAEFVIGPLVKEDVARLAHSGNISVPTVALNYLDSSETPATDLIQFGLSPQQAAAQSAELAWHHGVNKVLVMTPQGEWGSSVAAAFTQAFRYQGGTVLNNVAIDPKNLTEQVAQLLAVNQSEARAKQMSHITGRQLAYTPRRRQDANGIFLVAPPTQAREIEPLFRFYFAGNLPVFSTSLIYNGYQELGANQDINGTYFVDVPWLFSQAPYTAKLRQEIQATWPENYHNYSRLYGLGVDTFLLTQLFNRLVYMPTFGVSGVTGRLYLAMGQQVTRQLASVKIVNGQAVLIAS